MDLLASRISFSTRLARFFVIQYTKTGENIPKDHYTNYQKAIQYTKTGENIPKDHYINYQKAIQYTKWPKYMPNGHKIYPHFPFQGPPKFTQMWILGLKIYHLATLFSTTKKILKL
jgi:hypothetical protein